MLRRRMMRRLPAEYQEVEYLESTGVQWIDTGVPSTLTTALKFKIRPKSWTGNAHIGQLASSDSMDFRLFFYSSNTLFYDFGSSRKSISGQYTFNTDYNVFLQNGSIVLDGIEYQTYVTQQVGNDNIYIYGMNNGNGCSPVKAIFYFVEMYNSNIKNRSFIPAYRISDHKPCMFDLVSQQPFFNQGSGADFLLGPNVYA